MKTPINKENIYKALEQICKNENFAKSPRNVRLLRFLVEQTINNNIVKEQIIGLELFDKNYDPQKNDGKVRVYIYNLRKKLEEYYDTDGKKEDIIFSIDKGQYNVTFANRKIDNKNASPKKTAKICAIALASAITTLLAIWVFQKIENKYCWSTFLEKNTKTICLVSEHKVLWGTLPDGSRGLLRNSEINSDKDLEKFLSNRKDLDYETTDFSFMTKMAPLATQQLTKWFCSHKKQFSIIPESELSFESLKTNNIIFIGQWKTLGKLDGLFLKNSKVFTTDPNSITYQNDNKEIKYTSSVKNNNRIDYAIVSFMKMDNNNEAIFFSSNNDIGVIASVKRFTNKDWLSDFYKNIPDDSKYFNAMFKVEGLARTELEFELVQLEIIDN